MDIDIRNRLISEQPSFCYEFNQISYDITNTNGKEQKILNQVSGVFHSNRLSAILGPSGAGKTTLMNILAGQKHDLARDIKFTGICGTKVHRISYIAQNVSFLPKLTAKETIQFAAEFKLPAQTSKRIRNNIVNNIIDTLKLSNCCNVLVERLSGGERKRLSIAIELVSNPDIIFLDEPTSGLDSVSSLQIINHLHKLATNNRLVLCILHQPSSQLISLFDDVYVLSSGHCIYNGTLDMMIPYFRNAGFECPQFYNRADFALEIASKDITELKCLIKENVETEEVQLMETNTIRIYSDNSVEVKIDKEDTIDCKIVKSTLHHPISQFRQILILLRRSMLCTRRDFMFAQLRVVCHVLVGILLGVVFYDIGNESSKILTNSSCIFFFILFIFFANAMPTVLTVPLDTAVFVREHSNNWYSMLAYYSAKLISDIPLQIACPTFFLPFAYFLTGQPMEFDRFITLWIIIILTTLLAQLNGLVAGAMTNMQMGVFLVPVISIPMLIFSGFFARKTDVFHCLGTIFDISYFRLSFHGALKTIYGYERGNLTCSEIYCHYKRPNKFMDYMRISDDDIHMEMIGLICWIFVLQIIFFIVLNIKLKQYKK